MIPEKSKSITAEDILGELDRLERIAAENAERERFKKALGDREITEAVLVVHPKVAIYLKEALYKAKVDVQMYVTRLAPLDKIYVLTDRELISEIKRYRGLAEEQE